jgi:hypothetical protein
MQMNNVTHRIFTSEPATSGLGRVRDRQNHEGYILANIARQQNCKQNKGIGNKLNLEIIKIT